MTPTAPVSAWRFPDADRFMRGELRDGSYQKSHLSAALRFVTDWRTALDIGAHVGTWSKQLSAKFARVIAAEPSPDTYACLVENMQGFGCANVTCRNVAAGAAFGFVSMTLTPKEAARANTGARYVQPGGVIRCETIDSWHLPDLGFLKLDVEGSEPMALEGARDTILRCKPIVLYEDKGLCKRFGYAKDAPATILSSLGYGLLQAVGCDRIYGPVTP